MAEIVKKIKEKYEHYERHVSSVSLLAGFIIDSLTLQRIDLFFENLVIMIYLAIAGTGVILLSLYETGKIKKEWIEKFHLKIIIMLLAQFAFGGLFSAFFIFYSRSATIAASWPFLLLLLGLLLGNEFLKEKYQSLIFRISVFFFALFSFFIFSLPVLLKEMGAFIFILSGFAALAFIYLFVLIIFYLIPEQVSQSKKRITASIAIIYAAINVLYFTNILPPIPLSLKDAGIFHSIAKTAQGYEVTQEKQPWYGFLQQYDRIHISAEQPLYVFSAIFAPTQISAKVIHEWQFFDETKDKWTTKSRVFFSISGGRDGGYRGYSLSSNLNSGLWRVNIETERGQLIGRVKFKVIQSEQAPDIAPKIK